MVLIGVLTSAYYVGFLAGTYFVPRLTHRIGHIRSFAFCVMLVILTVQFQVVTPIYPVWLGTRVLQGLSLVGLYAVIESWLSASTTRQHRSALFAIYMMLNLGAGALAQQFLRLDGDAFALFNVITTLFCAAGLPIIATRQPQPAMKQMPRIRLPHLWQQTPIALVASLVSGLILGSLWGLLPLYAQARGLDMGQIGTYVAATIFGGVVMQWPLGWLSNHIDRRLVLAGISGSAALLAAVNLLFPSAGYGFSIAIVFAFGGMAFTLYPIAVAHLFDHVDRNELLSASSTVLLVSGAGSALGPLVAGALMTYGPPQLLFAWFAVLSAALTAYAPYRFMRHRRTRAGHEKFAPLVQTSLDGLEQRTPEETSASRPSDASRVDLAPA